MNNPITNANEANPISAEQEAPEMSMEGLFAEQETFREKLLGREIVKVRVIQAGPEYVLVDIGEKKEGIIPVTDFQGERTIPVPGSEIIAVLDRRGGEERHTVLSHVKAAALLGWDSCKKALAEKARVKGTILELVKGGYIVEVMNIRGFMPLSLSELYPAYKHHLPVNSKVRCRIAEVVREKNKLIVSRRQVLEEDEKARREKVLADVKNGDMIRVVVARTSKDALFVRFHGIEGAIRLQNIAWRNPAEAVKTYKRGQRIKAKLLVLDKETPRLEFGIKQLYPNPADILRRKYPAKTMVKAAITAVSERGMRVAVGENVEGFVSSSEFGSDLQPKVGETLSLVVLGVNPETFEVVLSVKRFEEVQNRKIMAQYLKGAPPLTLGQLLTPGEGGE